ncbi:pyruvate kinase [Balneolaceae bacterium YR4-1]|uniref:pyruvate kinase n=1 Tax=Halalkalibaculum roseum TaxID=2709311 RepID=A0A6M1T0P6_9BACT|nr:pyruvate kinase [Halalkalibaculum roseum]NGP75675.1 pyruvate kinase [Halalkalibaculum roseum]
MKSPETTSYPSSDQIEKIFLEVLDLRSELVGAVDTFQYYLDEVDENHVESARNLLHYLAFRSKDLRPLQISLAAMGLSSLGRAESHVMATVDAVANVLFGLSRKVRQAPALNNSTIKFKKGEKLLSEHTESLLGPAREGRGVRVMVTMPSEAADNFGLVYNLLQEGMDCVRINCAHDNVEVWMKIVKNLRKAERELGKRCRIIMELPGPKLRTGPLNPGPQVIKVRPVRNEIGRVIRPAVIWLTSENITHFHPSPKCTRCVLQVPDPWLQYLNVGNKIKLIDARGSKRVLSVVDSKDHGCLVETNKTLYLTPQTVLRISGTEADKYQTHVENIPHSEIPIILKPGDQLILTRNQSPGHPAIYDDVGIELAPAKIGCTLPEALDHVEVGEMIWFNDGKIGGVIDRIEDEEIIIRIKQSREKGRKLRGDKGINLPDSYISLPSLTVDDLNYLDFIAEYADVVGLSFVNSARDVEMLQDRLEKYGDKQPAIMLKIETKQGFHNLPSILLTAMRSHCFGVMIARGDLAVECGFERMAEVQEEILWLCEAAHVPVIWATQVLESVAKKGTPSRAEITDAAMGHRAECVMLNKGPYILNAVRTLDDILSRMQAHQIKKSSMLRELRLAREFTSIKRY